MSGASGRRTRDRERRDTMPEDWKARIRAVYGRLRSAVPGQLENYGTLRTWQSATDWARAVAGLRPGFAQAAVNAAKAKFTEFDVEVLRVKVGAPTDLRLKQDVQYWAACSLITKHVMVAVDVLLRSKQPNRPLAPPAGLVTRDTVPALPVPASRSRRGRRARARQRRRPVRC